MPIGRIISSIKAIVKGKIIDVLTKTEISNIKKVLTEFLLSEVENINKNANGADINKIATTRALKKKLIYSQYK